MSAIQRVLGFCLLGLIAALAPGAAQAQPAFSSSLSPSTVTEGGVATLTYDIQNGAATPFVTGAFTTTLPAGVTLATPASPALDTTCVGATLTAPDGGTAISLTDLSVGAFGRCTLSVEITSATAGSHVITSGDLTSSQGNSGTASSTLTVNAPTSAPTFTKSLSASSIAINGTTRVTYTIDNSANPGSLFFMSFNESLPAGIEVAPATTIDTSTCDTAPIVTASGGSISVFQINTSANTTCDISLDLKGTVAGDYVLLSGNLTGSFPVATNAGKSIAALTVTGLSTATPQLQKFFAGDPANAGGTVTLDFYISNGDRSTTATGLTFTDDLDTMIPGATVVAASLPSDPCGAGSSLSGSSVLTFSGGTLAPGTNCSFSVEVNVPGGTAGGTYTNTTSAFTGSMGATPFSSAAASDTLVISASTVDEPAFTLEFTDDPIQPGDTFTARYTITNASATVAVPDVAFLHDLSFSSATVAALPGSGFCGGGSFVFTREISGTTFLNVIDVTLPAGGDCTFDVTFQTDALEPVGARPTTTEALDYNNGVSVVSGPTASDTLVFEGGADLTLTKVFGQDTAAPGDTVSLTFAISSASESVNDAVDVAFTDDLNAFHTGSTFAALTSDSCGGTVSGLSSGTFGYSGGSVAKDDDCTIVIDVTLGVGDPSAEVTNTTSALSATAGGKATSAPAASDSIFIGSVEPYDLSFDFDTAAALPGDLIGLDVTITNPNAPGTGDATGILLTSSLNAALAGLAAEAPLPTNPCGAGSSLSGPNFLIMAGGTVAGGASCSFTVPVRVPGGAADGTYGVTASTTGTVGPASVSVGATAILTVDSDLLSMTKSFAAASVTAGDTVGISIDVTNTSATETVTDVAFTDDIGAMLSGATLSAASATCGSTATSSTTVLRLTSGTLTPGATCTVTATLLIPGSAPAGDVTNTTSDVSGDVGGVSVSSGAASDTITVTPNIDLAFSKSFADNALPAGAATTLTITIANSSPTATASDVGFTDNLGAMLAGTVAGGHTASAGCGGGSFAGSSFLTFSGGNIAAGDTCTLTATVLVPAAAAVGTYTNTTSQLFVGGIATKAAVSDTIAIQPAPTFSKAFASSIVPVGQNQTLVFTIDNTGSILPAASVAFTDTLPVGLELAAGVSTSCSAPIPAPTVTVGSNSFSYAGATIPAGASCDVSVTVVATTAGTFVNTTGALTSSLGSSGTATDTVTAVPQPGFAKAFTDATIAQGFTTTLTFTVDNSGSVAAASALSFTDTLPAGLQVAAIPAVSTTCTGGTLTATAGSGSISYIGGSVAAGRACTVQADVVGAATGSHTNTTGNLTSSLGNSGTASDSITVVPQPGFAKAFGAATIGVNQVTTLTFTVNNSGSVLAATALGFTDTLPTNMVVAATPNASTTCSGGTLTATAGAGVISYTGGSLAASSSCTVQVDVTTTATGGFTNLSGDLTSSLGNSGTATASLSVVPQPGFAKSFAPNPLGLGQVSTLTFDIDNSGSSIAVSALAFTDSLPAGMQVATPASTSNTCGGTLTATAGGGAVSLSGGGIAAGGTCQLTVDVTSTATGALANTSGDLTSSLGNSGTASATMTVVPQPGFAKSFADAAIAQGFATTLTFTVNNSGSVTAATALNFTDSLPAGLQVAATPAASSTCTGGTLTATAGSGSISYSGGSVAAGATCTVQADVIGAATGSHTNLSGDLTSSLGNSGTATDSITVVPQPGFAKVFAPDSILLGQSSVLTFTVDNSGSILAATALDFTDPLPAGMVVAATPNASTTCTGGTLTAAAGSGSIAYTGGDVAASATCTVSVDVTPSAAGTFSNTSGALTSSLGSSGTAADDLTVLTPEIGLSGSIGGAVANGGTLPQGDQPAATTAIALVVTVTNTGTSALSVDPVPVITGQSNVTIGTVIGPVVTTVAPGASTTFTVPYTPDAAGAFSFDVSLRNNDVDENPYSFTVSGTGLDVTAPSSYLASFDQDPVNGGNQGAVSFTFAGAEVGSTYDFSISSDGGGTPVTGTGTIATATDTIAGIDVSGLGDGTLTLTATLTDAALNTGPDATDTTTKDATAPAGYTVAFDQDPVNLGNETAAGFTFAGAEVGTGYAYTITSDGGGTPVTGTGTIATAADAITGLDLSGLSDGTLTLTVALTDVAGNTGADATDTAVKDATAPTLAIDAPIEDDDVVNAAEAPATVISGTSGDLADGTVVSVAVADGAAGSVADTTTISGGLWTVTLDLSALTDGALSVTADAADAAGNPAPQATASAVLDTAAPAGYSVSFDQDPVNIGNETAAGFTFAGAEVGAGYAYTITSDGGGTPVTGTGTIATAADAITGLDLSGLLDGTLTLTVALTDVAGNTGADATDTATKDATAPTLAIDAPIEGDDVVNAAEAPATVISGTSTDLSDGAVVTITVSDGAAGSVTDTTAVTGGIWSITLDLSGLTDGALSITADASDAAGNAAPQATAGAALDTTAPAGYSAGFDQDPVNMGNETAVSFTFAGAEVGAGYAFTITSDGGGTPVTGTGTIATATDTITGLDLSGLTDGTLTLTVALTDAAGNTGVDATDTATKDADAPTATLTGPSAAQSGAFTVDLVYSEAVTGLALTALDIDNGTASALTGSGTTYSFTVTPDHDGPVSIELLAASAVDASGNPAAGEGPIEVTADLTGVPNPSPLPDADGDGIADLLEGSGDRDGDGIPDDEDFDPQGYFYCEADGRIIPGGSFSVSGPLGSNAALGISNGINITRDGSTGEMQWFALVPGTFTMSVTYPTAVGIPSTTRLPAGTLDMTSLLPANPAFLGSSEVGATGFLADPSLAANPVFHTSFAIEPGDPFVMANNFPMEQCAENAVTVSASTGGAEANGGAPTDATLTISQARVSTVDTVITYSVGGSATAGTDFTALSGTATIPAGSTSVTITVPVLEDGDIEGPETVEITLTGVTGDLTTVLGGTLTGTATIADDDFAGIAVTNVDLVTSEGGNDDATMTFALLGVPSAPVTLSFAGDSQCTVSPATMTFTGADYTVPQALTIRAIDDDKVEGTHSCQPTATVASADPGFNGAPLALATVTVTDDLVDQIREPLTTILEEDLEKTIETQQKNFNRMAKGALQRLQAGRDLPCGVLQGFDVDGSVEIQDATGAANGTFGRDVYNCATDTREIIDGSFTLNKTEDTGLQALIQMAFQREKFLSDDALAGYFLGAYFSRTDVSGLGDGTIDGFGMNGGLYGARAFSGGLFLDYYLAAAAGRHAFDIDFDAARAPINARGDYTYLAGFGGLGISGQRAYENFVMKPRVAVDLAYAKAGDADVTARQLGLTHTGVIDLDDFSGARVTAEVTFESLAAPGGSEALAAMMRTSVTPRFLCEFSSYDSDAECGVGLGFAWERTNAASGLTFGFEVDVEATDDTQSLTFNLSREQMILNGMGSVVSRLSMPVMQEVKLEHGIKIDW
ncbi:DUF7933 domain-containing protein [Antarctobacter jejuensis]|uniref:DUF7933 domain-containing protein n=1 Tax=Antarctobacter jejuensis TaxID=1439938 RepID=UPI003FD2D603